MISGAKSQKLFLSFAHSSGIHQDGVLKDRQTYEIIDPQDVGLNQSVIEMCIRDSVHTARRDFHGETAENAKIPAEYTKTKNRAFPCKHEGPVSRFICRQASILVFGYFWLKKFIVRSTPIVANDRIASQKRCV